MFIKHFIDPSKFFIYFFLIFEIIFEYINFFFFLIIDFYPWYTSLIHDKLLKIIRKIIRVTNKLRITNHFGKNDNELFSFLNFKVRLLENK